MIIGLTGLAGSGKSEVARVLREDAGFRRCAFADPLKGMLASVGFTHDQLYGAEKMTPLEEFGGKTPRQMMQLLGTEWGRDMVHSEIWVTLWRRQAEGLISRNHPVVADDVRFPNEVEAIRALGGEVWRVLRPGVSTMNHASETQIMTLDVDRAISNDAGLRELTSRTISAYSAAASAG